VETRNFGCLTGGGLREYLTQVFATHCSPNFSLPWSRKRQYTSTSTGFAIGGKRLLTNAHSVECHTQVRSNSDCLRITWIQAQQKKPSAADAELGFCVGSRGAHAAAEPNLH
jgi:hypothetical protein